MSRGARCDVAVVGGGVVGSACALALAACGLDVALVEAREPARWTPAVRDLRVYAFSPDNADFLETLGVWVSVCDARVQPYRRMRVWDAAGGGELRFEADAYARAQLGWIVEHGLLADRLWQALQRAGVRVLCPAQVVSLDERADAIRLGLDDATRLDARLAVAADGADSTLRRLAGIEVDARDYAQHGVVCFVSSERPHEDTAWQRFMPGGPLALLPFADHAALARLDDAVAADHTSDARPAGHESSIVWSLPDADATRVLALDDGAFADALTRASGGCLGALRPTSARAAFPLRRQLARRYVSGRVVVAGDAAHVVHPLAGQGVNLGLRDVAALVDTLDQAMQRGLDLASPQRLQRWARTRRSENALAAHAFEAIHRAFASDALVPALLRGHVLGIAGRLPPLAHALWGRASGL